MAPKRSPYLIQRKASVWGIFSQKILVFLLYFLVKNKGLNILPQLEFHFTNTKASAEFFLFIDLQNTYFHLLRYWQMPYNKFLKTALIDTSYSFAEF